MNNERGPPKRKLFQEVSSSKGGNMTTQREPLVRVLEEKKCNHPKETSNVGSGREFFLSQVMDVIQKICPLSSEA